MKPKDYVVRVYVLTGTKIVGKDANGKSDPYLKIKLGKKKMSDLSGSKRIGTRIFLTRRDTSLLRTSRNFSDRMR